MPETTELQRVELASRLAKRYRAKLDGDFDGMRAAVDNVDAYMVTDRAAMVATMPQPAIDAFGDLAEEENQHKVDQLSADIFWLVHSLARTLNLNWNHANDTVTAAVSYYDSTRADHKTALGAAVTGPLNGAEQLQVMKAVTAMRA